MNRLMPVCITVTGVFISIGFFLYTKVPLSELGKYIMRQQVEGNTSKDTSTLNWSLDVTEELREGLQNLYLSCHPGEEGILQRKYERLLQGLVDYTTFHREAGKDPQGVRSLIWVCDAHQSCGGLADRLKGITFSLLVAMFTRRRLLLCWSSSVFGEHSYLKPNMIDWFISAEEAYNVGAKQIHMFGILGGIGIDVSVKHLKQSLNMLDGNTTHVSLATNLKPSALKNRTKNMDQQWIIRGLRRYGLAHLSPQEVNNLVGIVFRYLFQLTDELKAEVDMAHRELGLENQKYVGVHLRTGFAGSSLQEPSKHPKLIKNRQDWETVLECAVNTSRKLLESSGLIFLATDSTVVKHIATNKYGSQFRTLDHTLIHLDRMDKFPHKPNKNETKGILASWVDFFLLAQSSAHVRTLGSGFSIVAGQICMLPLSRAINGLQCIPETRLPFINDSFPWKS